MSSTKHKIPELPSKLRIGYANWGECDEKIYEAVENGLNVIIWFSIDLIANKTDNTKIEFARGPNYAEVAKMVKRFKDNNHSVINLISIGGWNSAHVCTNFTAEQYYEEWIKFNERISDQENEFYGFDGIDWDIEGNDKFESSRNHFTFQELNVMGEFSVLLKKNGYLVAMAPSESYLDSSTEEFSLSLLYNHPEWEKEVPNFTYHGRNCYSYLLAKFSVDIFDFISLQIYEGYTHSLYKYEREKIKFGEILENLVKNLTKDGFYVDFSMEKDSDLKKQKIVIDPKKLVIGLANGWAGGRFLFVDEKTIKDGYQFLKNKDLDVRGFMFWDIADEGKVPSSSKDGQPFYMAKVLKDIL